MDKRNLAIDLIALLVYLVVATPAITGIGLHEWLGLGVLVVFFVHIAAALARKLRVGNFVLDVLILVVLATATVSGLMVSGAVLPTFGLYAEGYYFWDPLHAISAKVLLALLLVHVVAHWKWIVAWFRKGKADRYE